VGFRLEVKHLTVRKSGYTLLNNVTFSVAPKEFVVILGANGAGKTTLLRAIAGERPYKGSVCIQGESLYDDPEYWFKQTGQVPIDNILHDRLPVSTALTYVGNLRGIPSKTLKKRIKDLLKAFGISHKSKSLICQLSSGERKKVNICAELLTEPGLLLLDEPTTNLDPDAEHELMQRLAEHAKRGTTIIVVSHTINSLDCCNRAIFLGNSEIVGILEKASPDWVWKPRTSEGTFESGKRISRSEFDTWLIARFKENQTQARQPSPSTITPSVPCEIQVSQASHRDFESDAKPGQSHYLVILARQIELLYYEGWRVPVRETWDRSKVLLVGKAEGKRERSSKRSILDLNWMIPIPLLIALAFGPLTGLLLSVVLPNEALVQSAASKAVSLDAGDASQAAFLIGLVAFLVGLLGSFREIVREINIYQHERLKGLRVKPYLLAKFTLLGTLYGVGAPFLMFIVLALNQDFSPEGLIFSSRGDILLSIVLTSMAGVTLGMAISSVGSSGEWATILMGTAVIANALLSGLVKNEAWEKLVNFFSAFVPSRWALEGLKTTTELYCWGNIRVFRDHYSPTHLLSVWMALVIYALTSLMVAYLALHYKDTWFTRSRRLKLLVTQGNYVYSVVIIIMLAVSLGLYKWSKQSHQSELFEARVSELHGLQRAVGQISAAKCVEEQPPSPLIVEEPQRQEIVIPTSAPLVVTVDISGSASDNTQEVVTVIPTAGDITAVASAPGVISTPAQSAATAPVPTSEPTSTFAPSPTLPVPEEPMVVVPVPVTLYFSPATHYPLASLSENSTLMLLSQATENNVPWLRVQVSDETGHTYVGWVPGNNPPLSESVWKAGLERKVPPDCATPVASTYREMTELDLAAGRMGPWVSTGSGDVALVIDLYRDELGTISESLTLHLQRNGQDLKTVLIEPQRKRFLLQNGVYNAQISPGDRITLSLEPASSNTLKTLRSHVSIFFVPKDCEFREG
jgi:ABC-type multidrug transport system ATPase subunit